MSATTFTFTDPDGFEIFVYKWVPDTGKPKAVVQVVHGLGEHALRYERFARYLNQAGFVVYADDHRGHGKTAGSLSKVGIIGTDGWNGMVKDENQLSDIIEKENPGLPLFLFGHSMGSFIGQRYIECWGNRLKGVVLTGTTGLPMFPPESISFLEKAAEGDMRDKPPTQNVMNALNTPFEPAKTPFDWLSRDEEEVQKYINDPFCGFGGTNGMTLDMARGCLEMLEPEQQALIPKSLPVLIACGEMDPVGAHGGAQALAKRYEEIGIKDVQLILYPGARHEVLNETNRDEVQQDIRTWLENHLK